MTDAPADHDGEHPLRGSWRQALPARWGGHVSPQFLVFVLIVHAVALGWFVSSWDRVRLLLYDYTEVATEADANDPPEDLTLLWGYEQDAPEDLTAFRDIAAPLVAGIEDAPMRARALANYIYALRTPGKDAFDEDVRFGPMFILARMREGFHGNCGQMSTVLATFWRSLGGHSRAVRWGTPEGEVGHYAMELWDPERGRWFYYDMNLNGYGVDDDGAAPLSVASLRGSLLTGEDLHLRSNSAARDFSEADLKEIVLHYPVEWYVLNNAYLDWSRARRFGPLNRFHNTLAALPHPWDRIVDNLTGARDRRIVVRGRIQIEGLFTFKGARIFVGWLSFVVAICGVTLARSRPWLRPTP